MRAAALALLLAAAAAGARGNAPTALPLAADERAAVDLAARRGALLWAYDQAAWHGTDDLVAKLPDYAKRVGGWFVEGTADTPHLTFYNKSGTAAVYDARFDGRRLIESRVWSPGEETRLTDAQQRLVTALRTASGAFHADRKVFACTNKPFNTVVLPPEAPDGPTAVYFLSPQLDNAIQNGGHYRVEVDAAGVAGPVRAFTRSCLGIADPPPSGVEFAFVTHLLDATPTELHVFTSLALGKPLLVGTVTPTDRLWTVAGARISGPVRLPAR